MDVIEALSATLDQAAATDPGVLADGEAVAALHRQLERLQAVVTRATAAFDAGGSWAADGARTSSAWVATTCRLPFAAARHRLGLGRELRHMPLVEAAWLAGEVGMAQVALLADARGAEPEALARDEATLVDHARQRQYRHFARILAYWRQLADPDGAEAEAEALHHDRRLHLSESFEGCRFVDGMFDPVGGAIFATALGRIERQLWEADWAEVRARLGQAARARDLVRTPAQRRADAAVEMARRAGAVAADARQPEPLFTVFVGYETLAGRICELAGGAVVSPGSLLGWLDEAWVERVVFDGPDRILNVGVHRRFYTGGTRRAAQLKGQERECFHPYCDVAATDCDIDHIQPWAEGGLTIDENGRPACSWHNRNRQPVGASP